MMYDNNLLLPQNIFPDKGDVDDIDIAHLADLTRDSVFTISEDNTFEDEAFKIVAASNMSSAGVRNGDTDTVITGSDNDDVFPGSDLSFQRLRASKKYRRSVEDCAAVKKWTNLNGYDEVVANPSGKVRKTG
jgi:hypothetical protein